MIALLRHALRSLRRSPAFTLTMMATLGIGIGLNAAIFTVVDCVLLRPLGYHDADRIVGDYTDLSNQVKGVESVAYYQYHSDGIRLNGAAFDARSYTCASLAVLIIALLATFVPARAAANVDPMTVLRSE